MDAFTQTLPEEWFGEEGSFWWTLDDHGPCFLLCFDQDGSQSWTRNSTSFSWQPCPGD